MDCSYVRYISVQARADQNRMNSRNLGVVFGRESSDQWATLFGHSLALCIATLMRSADASAEFADMAGKALSIEWMVDNALDLFPNSTP